MRAAQEALDFRERRYAADRLLHKEDISAELAKKMQKEFQKEAKQLMLAAEMAGEQFELPEHLRDLYRPPVRYFHDPRGLAQTKSLREELEERLFAEGNEARAKVIQAEKRINKHLDFFAEASDKGLLAFKWKDPRGQESIAEKRRDMLESLKRRKSPDLKPEPILDTRLLRFLGKAEKMETVRTLLSEEYRNKLKTEYAAKVEQVARLESLGDLFLEASVLKRAEHVLDAGLRKIKLKPVWEVKKTHGGKAVSKPQGRVKHLVSNTGLNPEKPIEDAKELTRVDLRDLQAEASVKPTRTLADIYPLEDCEKIDFSQTQRQSFRICRQSGPLSMRKFSSGNSYSLFPMFENKKSVGALHQTQHHQKFQGSIHEEGSIKMVEVERASPSQSKTGWRETSKMTGWNETTKNPTTLAAVDPFRTTVQQSIASSRKSVHSTRTAYSQQQILVQTSSALVEDIRRFTEKSKSQSRRISHQAKALQRTYRNLKDRSDVKKMEKKRAEALLSDFEQLHGMVDQKALGGEDAGPRGKRRQRGQKEGDVPLAMLLRQRATWYGRGSETTLERQRPQDEGTQNKREESSG